MTAPDLVLLDLNETLSDLAPLRRRFVEVGSPGHLLDTWFAAVLRDGFALTAVGASAPLTEVARAVLLSMLGSEESASYVLDGLGALGVHPEVPAGLQQLADAGARAVPYINGARSSA